jgi:glucose-1-phosphate thymidylyltransferase
MREIWGLVPAAGKATRLGRKRGPSKEILPLLAADAAPGTAPRPVVQNLLESYRLAGVHRALVLLRQGKWDIPRRLGTGEETGVELAYRVLPETRGVPFTLAHAAPFLGDRLAALGFPDHLVQPRDLLARLIRHREQTQGDVALALVPSDHPESSDLVDMTSRGKVRRIEIKPEASTLKWTWVYAVWTPRFTRYLVQWTEVFNARSSRLGREPHMGDVLSAALASGFEIDALQEPRGKVLDIGTPATLAQALARGIESAPD